MSTAVPDVRCAGTPDAGPALSFNHVSSELISALGDPRHRGFDLVAPASATTQSIEGWISYTIADKALEDEIVDVFACRDDAWKFIGSALTDDEGHFALTLDGNDRLPIAMRDLYVSVGGDRTGVGFLGYVAPDDQPLIVSDVDGTLTSSENAFAESLALGGEPDVQPGASAAYSDAIARGYQVVYVTSRGGQYTTDTRSWLDDKALPRGPLRLSPSFLTLPGGDTIDYKTQTITALTDSLPVIMGIGNRATDVTAYSNVGIAATATFVKLPEYQSELQSDLDGHLAVGVASYDDLRTMYIDALPQR
jgi:phosphatidate phosphatase PAH1